MGWIITAVAAAILVAVFVFLSAPGRAGKDAFGAFAGRSFAHRGLHSKDKTVPENSLAAFAAAKSAGYGIELDIQLTKDGQVVVFHDDELERVCGVPGRVDSYTYEELCDFAIEGTSERIPLFTEVLSLVDGAVPLIVELKMGPQNEKLCRLAYEILSGYSGAFCIESFDPRIVGWFKKEAKGFIRGQLSAPPDVLENGISGRIVSWGLSHFLGRPQFIAYQAARLPLPVIFARHFAFRVVWTLTPEHDVDAWLKKNDAAIFEHYDPPAYFR